MEPEYNETAEDQPHQASTEDEVQPRKKKYARVFFALSFLIILYLFFLMLKPFLVSIILAITVVSLFYPHYVRLNRSLGDRRSLSAILMCTVVTLLIILPLLLFFIALFDEINNAYADFRMRLSQGDLAQFPPWDEESIFGEAWNQLVQYMGFEGMNVPLAVSSLIDRLAKYLLSHYSEILGGLGAVLLHFSIMIFSMFFFFRDGQNFLRELKKLIPLNPEYQDMLLAKLGNVISATFLGIFATGMLQGIAAGLIFLVLGISNPILWGTATAFFSLVPIVGTAAVWVPMAVYLLVTGSLVKGILLLVLGGTIIGVVDNFVRPLVIEDRGGGMHLLMIFFALLGGLILFGPAGLVLGPLVAAVLITFIEIYKIEFGLEST